MESSILAFVYFLQIRQVSFLMQRLRGFAGLFVCLSVGGTCRLPMFVLTHECYL